ncbi:hypothetical protein AXG93_2465s1010 [Marchantia polymorpha subsp. ruderalis]|uniref:Uncharacterized protein n=1 Tax=Marchantia polymorpha subsp. ruderalis TaxID=1480154 RepID=A0A176W2L2_MARPO|nr:hypothetical protein AXG93_2465s1010 [Marchantia polymorpha subsp. ruderalis]
MAPCVFVLFWLVDAVPLVQSTQLEPEQPTLVLVAVFLYALIAVVMFVAYVPYNASLICDSLGRNVPWYVILGAFVTAVLSVVAVVGYCSDQRGVAGVGPKPARTVDGDELGQMVDV